MLTAVQMIGGYIGITAHTVVVQLYKIMSF